MPKKNLIHLLTFVRDDAVNVVIEVSKGAHVILEYLPEWGVFGYLRSLAKGLTYPHDWGFLPSSRGEDIKHISERARAELDFFAAAAETGNKLKFLGWENAAPALKTLRAGARKFAGKAKK